MDAWEKLRAGYVDDALRDLRNAYDSKPKSPTFAIAHCVARMYLRDWKSAWEQVNEFRQRYPWSMEIVYEFAGTAKWCLGEYDAAVCEWKEGVGATYTDAAGGLMCPLLLYFAAVFDSGRISTIEALDIIQRKLDRKSVRKWPMHLALLVQGEIDVSDTGKSESVRGLNGTSRCDCQIRFWEGVVKHSRGDQSGALESFAPLARLSWADFDENRESFIDTLWGPEYFLARCEHEKQT